MCCLHPSPLHITHICKPSNSHRSWHTCQDLWLSIQWRHTLFGVSLATRSCTSTSHNIRNDLQQCTKVVPKHLEGASSFASHTCTFDNIDVGFEAALPRHHCEKMLQLIFLLQHEKQFLPTCNAPVTRCRAELSSYNSMDNSIELPGCNKMQR